MDAITSFFTFLILLAFLVISGAALYKCRGDISNWLNSRAAPADYSARKVVLQRQLEDAQRLAERKAEDVKMQLAKISKREEKPMIED